MTDNNTKLQKSFHFNPRYKDSPAFDTAFTIIKACGDHSFYREVKEGVSLAFTSSNDDMGNKVISDMDYLIPRETNVTQELLDSAKYKLSRTVEGVTSEGYSSQTEFEDMTYAQKVFFCLTNALSFFAQTQKVEADILRIQENRPKILANIEKEKRRQEIQEMKKPKRKRR